MSFSVRYQRDITVGPNEHQAGAVAPSLSKMFFGISDVVRTGRLLDHMEGSEVGR